MNKKTSCLLIILGCVIALTGCGNSLQVVSEVEATQVKDNSRIKEVPIKGNTLVLIDKKTNVQYLKVIVNTGLDGGVAVTPLYQPDGKPYIGDEVSQNRFTIEELNGYTTILTDNDTGIGYLKVIKNTGLNGGVSIIPLLNDEGGYLTEK